MRIPLSIALLAPLLACAADASPYSKSSDDGANPYDAPVPGFVGPNGTGKARLFDGRDSSTGGDIYLNPDNYVNPVFRAWASTVSSYSRADTDTSFNVPTLALGPVTGDNWDVVSLGDLTATQITAGSAPGTITLAFTTPLANKPGADFAVFENALLSGTNEGGAGIGGVFAELAFVEVSTDGDKFVRFPSVSLTTSAPGAYGSLDATKIFNLAGKHLNAHGDCWGTPFDLSQLVNQPAVLSGKVQLSNINFVRFVDIPGKGTFVDSQNNPIYDPWKTFGSGGFDLEAVGAISVPVTLADWLANLCLAPEMSTPSADPDGDHLDNLLECAMGTDPLHAEAGAAPVIDTSGGQAGFSFTRDTRVTNLRIDVEFSTDLKTWQPVARSDRGAGFASVAPYAPVISDASASTIQSIGVIRRHKITNVPAGSGGTAFFRLKVSELP